MKPVGVLLCAKDFADKTEFQETYLVLLALKKYGIKTQCITLGDAQHDVIKGLFLSCENEEVHCVTESSFSAISEIISLKESVPESLSALILPGGFGAIQRLTTLETHGNDYTIDKELLTLAQEIYKQHKPLGFISQAGVLAPKLVDADVRVTLGTDVDRAELLDGIGAEHVSCPADDIVINLEMKIVSTPGKLSEKSDGEAAAGIDKLVRCVMEWIK
ncbi:isoprenoid biosynthesis protein with amidotransferase-like domain [Enterobacterales bacterium]|nr:isoprenoid biosynthesis protein with amidotransferase-like domain [Enterobacterales bacterium]